MQFGCDSEIEVCGSAIWPGPWNLSVAVLNPSVDREFVCVFMGVCRNVT